MFRGQKNSRFYWKHFGIWAVGIVISFLATIPTIMVLAALGMTEEEGSPVVMAVLFLPLVVFGAYGMKKRRFMSYFPNYVYTGKTAVIWGMATIMLYPLVVLFFAFWIIKGL